MTVNEAMGVLNLRNNFTEQDLKKAYRTMARMHHPDLGGDSTKFREVQTAYNILKTKRGFGNIIMSVTHSDLFSIVDMEV